MQFAIAHCFRGRRGRRRGGVTAKIAYSYEYSPLLDGNDGRVIYKKNVPNVPYMYHGTELVQD